MQYYDEITIIGIHQVDGRNSRLVQLKGNALTKHSLLQRLSLPTTLPPFVKGARGIPLLYNKKHSVVIQGKTKLNSIIKKKRIDVNTRHHQMVKKVAPGFLVNARSEKDEVIEGIETKDDSFLICVQWHPELMKDKSSRLLFDTLISAASKQRSEMEN